jgi:anti-sigma regulatory factor (Ser/Thr protein kinase)
MVDYRASFRGTPSSVRDARRAIVNYAKMCGFSQQETHEIALAAGEALANAVEHGNKDLGFVSVVCGFADGVLTIDVSDDGPGFDFATIAARRRDPDALRGFGISIMHALMDGVHYEGRGSRVSLRKRLRGGAEEQTKEA